jgi:ADP-heptose:LPS heptosyltransferase
MSWTLDGRPLRRVLVSRLRYLGDVVMSTVVVEMLRRGDPELEIDFLCEAAHADVLAAHPELRRVHALGARRRGADARARSSAVAANQAPARGTMDTIRAIRGERYDLAVDLFFNPRSAWLLALGGIAARIGGTASRSRGRLYTHRVVALPEAQRARLVPLAGGGLGDHLSRLAPLRHHGTPFLDWFAHTASQKRPAPRIARPPLTDAAAAALAGIAAVPGQYTLLAPGATWPSKEWPRPHWRSLAVELTLAGHRLAVLQPPGRPELAQDIATVIAEGTGGALPALPLQDALAVVAGARAVVAVDGGIMHAAVGMQVPTVALFGPTDPAIWFPYEALGPYRVLATRPHCHPCHRHDCDAFICLPDLAPDAVQYGLDEVLARAEDQT